MIGPGAAPVEVFDSCLSLIRKGGLFTLSLNDHALTTPAFPARLASAVKDGTLKPRFEENGPHLPGINMTSTVYVFEKL